MNERQEQTADVLGRLTVLGTIVLPMNIITGLWGMNVLVPGQDIENLNWFLSSMPNPTPSSYFYLEIELLIYSVLVVTVGLLCFGFLCYFAAKRVYKIV